MRVMILDGSDKNDDAMNNARQITEKFFKSANHEINAFTLRDLRIAPCCGFFCCWIKTPGICIVNDIACDIGKSAMISDYWIFFTPVTFGGYSSELKKAIDRMTPILLPHFTKARGEVHHKPRYENHPHLVVFGSTKNYDAEIEDIFNSLTQRNSINFHNRSVASKVILQTDSLNTIKAKVIEAFSKVVINREYE
ncbi:MAG: flavodoxin family protein [Candidatus Omnitrophota bacterium]